MKKPITIILISIVSLVSILLIVAAGMSIRKTLVEGPLPPDMPYPVPCKIAVIQDGKPLEGATVVLNNFDDSKLVWTVRGVTDKKGVANIKTHDQYSGAIPGEYKVTITKDVSRVQTVDPKYASTQSTPVKIEVKRSLKLKVDVGPAVSIPYPDYSGLSTPTGPKSITPAEVSYYPCKITLLRNGEPLEGVKIDFSRARIAGPEELRWLSMDYEAVSDSNGLASFYSEETFGKDKQKFEGLPVGEYTIFGGLGYEAYDERFKGKISKHISYRDKFIVTEEGLEMTIDVAELEK